MMPLYTILSKEIIEDKWRFVIHMDPEHIIFKGHFPNIPIVPGAVLVQIVKELAENILCKKIVLSEAQRIKFSKMIFPSKSTKINVSILLHCSDSIKINAEFIIENTPYCIVIARYKECV